jgi:3-methyladenine DNA glycosylase AlkD
MNKLSDLQKELKIIADPQKAKLLQGYFKTGKGEYGEGDIFLGITVPVSRQFARKYKNLKFSEITKLLKSKFHEERLIALLILVHNFNLKDEKSKKEIYEFYLNNTKHINNWDLVDLSAHEIIGQYLSDKNADILIKLAKSENIWGRRIAVISTFEFIRNNRFNDSLRLAKILLQDEHDLMHKAVGWMLREIGKRDMETEIKFLDKHYGKMPRTMLRYAIERFPEKLRMSYLKGK